LRLLGSHRKCQLQAFKRAQRARNTGDTLLSQRSTTL
jgi:hypothetical protein